MPTAVEKFLGRNEAETIIANSIKAYDDYFKRG